ncbi:MAG: ribosome maturation factor RimP [Balneolaceae bacterium]
MHKQPLEQIRILAEPVVQQHGLFLVDVELTTGNGTVVWVYIDSESGFPNVDTCSKISRELSVLFDAEELFNGAYRLNVSSPGLGRALTDYRQYPKNKGRKASVLVQTEQGTQTVTGTLVDVSPETLSIEAKGKTMEWPFSAIRETKIEPSL